jgi:hypothetical protein
MPKTVVVRLVAPPTPDVDIGLPTTTIRLVLCVGFYVFDATSD